MTSDGWHMRSHLPQYCDQVIVAVYTAVRTRNPIATVNSAVMLL